MNQRLSQIIVAQRIINLSKGSQVLFHLKESNINFNHFSFYTNPNQPSPNAYKFSPGIKQQFPPSVAVLNTTLYRMDDLTNVKDDYYPVVLSIEAIYPQNYQGRAKKSFQFTYGQFSLDNNNLKFKFLKQKFQVRISFFKCKGIPLNNKSNI